MLSSKRGGGVISGPSFKAFTNNLSRYATESEVAQTGRPTDYFGYPTSAWRGRAAVRLHWPNGHVPQGPSVNASPQLDVVVRAFPRRHYLRLLYFFLLSIEP